MPAAICSLEVRSRRADEAVSLGIALLPRAAIAVVIVGVGIGRTERSGVNRPRGSDRPCSDAFRRTDGPAYDIAWPESRLIAACSVIAIAAVAVLSR
jgi:hypothetical protein